MLLTLAAISVTSCATVGRRATCGITVTLGCVHSGLSGGSGSGFSASSGVADRVLQAACRGVVRKAVGDQCPPCNIYIIARAGSGLPQILPRIFPGCRIEPWEPSPPRLRGKPAEALQFIKTWFADDHAGLLRVKLVMDAIGESSRANFNKNVRKHPGFRLHLGKEGFYEERSASGLSCRGFRQELEDEPPSAAIFLNDGPAVRPSR